MSSHSLIDQLEDAVSAKNLARRADVLRRVTDLFLSGSGKYSEAQIDLFDDVMSRLVGTVEAAVRAQFGSRLADVIDAPSNVIRLLAFDNAADVAAPVLARSARLAEQDLIHNAETMSQDHLLAISRRKELREGVTDVLVTRGNREVLVSTSSNTGSRFSAAGFSALVEKAVADDGLTLCLWSRPDIPRQDMVRLFRNASEGLRLQLEAANPRHADQIRSAVAIASERIQAMARSGSADYRDASASLPDLHARGLLNEALLRDLVNEAKFDQVAVALSLICNLPIDLVERTVAQGRGEQMMLMAKAVELSWPTARALIEFQSASKLPQMEVDQYFASYTRMQVKTAQMALQFYRLRDSANRPTVTS